MSILEERKETARQERTGDNKFFGTYLYLFELQLPTAALNGTDYTLPKINLVYPLAINPAGYAIEDPFTVAVSPGTNGGLVVEENGIIQRRIKINGTTGFAPKPFHGSLTLAQDLKANSSYFPRGKFLLDKLSGQRHLQFLQDRVFRNYADLKRDPRFAKDVKLFFHNIKDDEHWQVIPENFNLNRGPTLYYYEISLIAVAPAQSRQLPKRKEVRSWFDKLKDGIATARAALQRITGYINVINQVANEIAQVVSSVVSVVEDVINIANEIANVINGVARAAADILNRIRSIAVTARNLAVELQASITNFGPTIAQAWHGLADEFEGLGIDGSFRNALRDLPPSRDPLTGKVVSTTSTAATNAQTLAELGRSGTALSASDIANILTAERTDAPLPRFSSVEHYRVSGSDTLASISSRFLGDVQYWWTIATINNLRPPYISQIPLPNTIRPGETLIVPSLAEATPSLAESGVLTDGRGTLEAQLLFRDAKLVRSTRFPNRYDLQLDSTKNNSDVLYVEGVENLKQAMNTRLDTLLGENVLFPNVGLNRVIGMGEPLVDAEILKVYISQTIAADTRVAAISAISVSNTQALDRYDVVVDVAVRGFNSPVKLATTQTM